MKKHITVVPSDKLIMVEGEALFFEFVPLFNMRALQWHEGKGHVECEDQPNKHLRIKDYLLEVLPYVALFEAEKQRIASNQSDEKEKPGKSSLAEAKSTKRLKILEGADNSYHIVTAQYSIPEVQSWEKQRTQAEALLADETAFAPEVRALAENRNIPVLEFARRIIENAAKAEQLSLSIIMQQQTYEDMLKAAATLEEIDAIKVEYILPTEEIE